MSNILKNGVTSFVNNSLPGLEQILADVASEEAIMTQATAARTKNFIFADSLYKLKIKEGLMFGWLGF